jgi:hypothetical protein
VLVLGGWQITQEGVCGDPNWGGKVTWEYTIPRTWEKTSPGDHYTLRRMLKGLYPRNDGSREIICFEVLNLKGEHLFTLPQADWGDWSAGGDLLFSREGKLFRLKARDISRYAQEGDQAAKLIADLNPLVFEPVETPFWATQWGGITQGAFSSF